MATIDRFKDAVEMGTITDANDLEVPLSAQMKYDYLAAVHTMEQLDKLAREIENRKRSRSNLKEELFKICNSPKTTTFSRSKKLTTRLKPSKIVAVKL